MESTAWTCGSGHAHRWRLLLVALASLMMLGMVSAPVVRAQEATETAETPDVVIPGTGDPDDSPAGATPAVPAEATATQEPPAAASPEETEPASASASSVIQISATDPGRPAVIAHGLAFLTGEQSVWQVREVEPGDGDEAVSEVSNAAFVYQVEGSSIIRNDVTGKRALLNPGEAYFKAGGDPYTTFADAPDSRIWIFEVVGPSDVEADAFYESPLIDDYTEGVFDALLIRYVLEPGESATLPDHTGPALVMSTDGDIDVESGGLGLLATGDGQLIIEDATVTNNSASPAVFVMPAFGPEVDDATSSAEPASLETTGETETDPGDQVTDTDAVTDAEPEPEPETTEDSEPAPEPEAPDPAADDTGDAGAPQTSINITALADLYVVVVADGVTVFDGPIPDGGQSGTIVGSTFEVYTSYGAATLFSNACGEEFYMGFEEGEATYTLSATPDSCAP